MKTNCIGLLDSEVVTSILKHSKEPPMSLSTKTHELSIKNVGGLNCVNITHISSGESTNIYFDSCDPKGFYFKDGMLTIISTTVIDDLDFAVLNKIKLDENSTKFLSSSCELMDEELGPYPSFSSSEDGYLYCIVREENLVRIV